jgi:hypothetical protein
MTIHYAEAARRHHEDATLLFEHGRIPNADHHYGLAAECAMVGIIRSLPGTGHLFDADGEVKGPSEDVRGRSHGGAHLRQHVNALWKSYWQLVGKHDAKTTMKGVSRKENPFDDWAVRQRYFADGHWTDVTIVEKHRDAATRLLTALQVALTKQTKKAAGRVPPRAGAIPEDTPEDGGGEAQAGDER